MSLDFYLEETKPTVVFRANITHNLNKMAREAGIYKVLWYPEEELGLKKAKDVIPLLGAGLERLKANPEYYKQFNAENGWGVYENFVEFVEEVLEGCISHPEADIVVSI